MQDAPNPLLLPLDTAVDDGSRSSRTRRMEDRPDHATLARHDPVRPALSAWRQGRWLAIATLLGSAVLGVYIASPRGASVGPRDTIASEGGRDAGASDRSPTTALDASSEGAHKQGPSHAEDVSHTEDVSRAEDALHTEDASHTEDEPRRGGGSRAEAESRTTPLPVTGIVVEHGPFEIPVEGTGRAEAEERAELAPRIGERIIAVHVAPGDVVRAGDVLVELDARLFEIGLREATAARERAALQFDAELFADEGAPSERREKVAHRTGLTEAEQRVLRAELDLESVVLRAPFAGRVATVSARVGERAQAERALVTIVALDPIRVPVEILEADFGLLDPGDRARLSFPALGERFEAKVRALGPEIDPERGTGLAYVEISNPEGRIRPGMFAQVSVAADVIQDRLAVPRDAVLERDRRLLVFLAKGGRAEWSYVQTGMETAERIEIVSGVAPGDTVLVGGHLTLAHGAPISVKLANHGRELP